MSEQYKIGEQLVWLHIDDETKQKMQELVVVRNVRIFTGRPYYQVQVLRTGDPANAWHDELRRFQVVK